MSSSCSLPLRQPRLLVHDLDGHLLAGLYLRAFDHLRERSSASQPGLLSYHLVLVECVDVSDVAVRKV